MARYAFIMDPLREVVVDHDTTFAFMLEAQRRGAEVWYGHVEDVGARGEHAVARLARVEVRPTPGDPYRVLEDARVVELSTFTAVFMRKDPPVDARYLHATHVLDLLAATRTPVVNDPRGLREAQEHLWALRYPSVSPETVVSASAVEIREFLERVGGKAVLKPVDGFGGRGILLLRADDPNLASLLELSTDRGRTLVVVQRYLDAVRTTGDKRVIVIDGEPLGAIARVPAAGAVRGNMAAGGRAQPAPVDARDREICALLAPELRRLGLLFVGLDVIGGMLTEVNVTSPTGLQEVNRFDGTRLEARLFDLLERPRTSA